MTVLFFQRWSLATINHLLSTRFIPGLIGLLSLLGIFFLSPNPTLQQELFGSLVSSHHYHLLEGGLWATALFAVLLAFYKNNSFFLLSGAWVLCNLRLGSIFLHQDAFWLQLHIPPELLPYFNQLTVGMYFLLTQQLLHTALNLNSAAPHNRLLNGLASSVFIVACLPFEAPFQALITVALPLGLGSALWLSLQRLISQIGQLLLWQVLLVSVLLAGVLAYGLNIWYGANPLISIFTAFVFFVLCQSVVIVWFLEFLRQRNQQHTELYSQLHQYPLPLIRIDHDGLILYANRAFQRLSQQLIHMQTNQWTELFPVQNWKFLAQCTRQGKAIEVSPLQSTPNRFYHHQFRLFVKRHPFYFLVSLQPITHDKESVDPVRAHAKSTVLNQHGLEKALNYTLTHLNNHQPCFLAYLEISQISQVSRTHGHAAGDALLQSISERLHTLLQDRYAFGRIGNDDFVFIMPNTTTEDARTMAQELTHSLNNTPIKTETRDYKLQVHMGLIELGPDMDEQAALRMAQSASTAARRNKNELIVYEHDSLAMQYHAEELTLFQRLENGSTQGLFIEMQPLLNLSDPVNSLNVEVLLRVRRANGDLIPIQNFIMAAEENGTISTIDKWVFVTTLEWLAKHQEQLHNLHLVTINLSGSSLNNDKFIADLFVILDQYKAQLNRLCVEITEGVALQDLARTRTFMSQLQNKGVRIALDDFGAGYTSFSYLRELPANLIKIDGALIRDMLHKESNIAIVRTLVELAHNLGMACVAEWVEDAETLSILNTMRVHYAQGYAISPSVSPTKILQTRSVMELINKTDTQAFIENNYPTLSKSIH